jgi:hypothetical protein
LANTLSSEPGRIVSRAAADLTKPQLQVKVAGGRPTNLRIVRQDQLALLQADELFQPDFLDEMCGFVAFRRMDWMETKGSERTDLLIRDTSAPYSQGVPLETIVALANRTGMRPWINVPHLANDSAIKVVLAYLDANLKPGLRAIVNFTNECAWNTIFVQTKYAVANSHKKGD